MSTYKEGYMTKYRRHVAGSDKDPCVYCGRTADTIDHIVATSVGGASGDRENWAPMCRGCNNDKGNSSVLLAMFHYGIKARTYHVFRTEQNQIRKIKGFADSWNPQIKAKCNIHL